MVANSIYQTLPPTSFHVGGYQQLLGRQEQEKAGVSHPFSIHPPASLPGIQSFLVSWPTPMPAAAPGVGIFRWLHTVSLVCHCHLFHHLQTQFSVESSLFTMLSPVILTCHHTWLQKDGRPGKSPAKTGPTTHRRLRPSCNLTSHIWNLWIKDK